MKRDMDLARKILLWIEAQPHAQNTGWDIQIPGASEEEVGYHIHLLGQAGLLKTIDGTADLDTSPSAMADGLTWRGHDFIDAMRDDTIWAKAKKHVLAPAAGATFDILLSWLKAEARARLGLPPS